MDQMSLNYIDYSVILAYFALVMGVGLYYTKRAGKNMEEFFLSGRALPWWVAGTSIAAMGFAADTPFMVTELVRRNGIAGNWFLWCFAMSNLSATFLFVRFWRRAGILTELEIIEERYEGRSAGFLRGFQSIFYGIAFSALNIGFIMLAMQNFITVMLGWNEFLALAVLLVVTMIYAVAAGLWGVVASEVVQFVIAFFGSVFMAVVAVNAVGGLGGIETRLVEAFGVKTAGGLMSFIPASEDVVKPFTPPGQEFTWTLFLVYIFVIWWSSEKADGNGMFIQRVMATKNEKHAFFAGVWFNILYYAFLMWPWILVALISMADFPDLTNHVQAYPLMIKKYLPVGLRGIMFAAFLAAFMSSVTGLINWGSSYMINDFYKRFIKPDASQRHYVWVGRGAMLVVLAAGIGVWSITNSIADAWKFMAELFSGLGAVWLARWFWWRVNAWTEITAYILSVVGCVTINVLEMSGVVFPEWQRYVFICIFSVTGWITVTFLTAPVSTEKLKSFVRKVNPGGPGWQRITRQVDQEHLPGGPPMSYNVFAFVLGAIVLFMFVFGIGSCLFGDMLQGALMIAAAVLCGSIIYRLESFRAKEERKAVNGAA
ncbi:MAG TPA: sodium:solute symporter family protein [Candidatus Glassbacteria bacterium]|nr:sodium:solute symporter family protein [Candidatus Glassbacteria bacterium]